MRTHRCAGPDQSRPRSCVVPPRSAPRTSSTPALTSPTFSARHVLRADRGRASNRCPYFGRKPHQPQTLAGPHPEQRPSPRSARPRRSSRSRPDERVAGLLLGVGDALQHRICRAISTGNQGEEITTISCRTPTYGRPSSTPAKPATQPRFWAQVADDVDWTVEGTHAGRSLPQQAGIHRCDVRSARRRAAGRRQAGGGARVRRRRPLSAGRQRHIGCAAKPQGMER